MHTNIKLMIHHTPPHRQRWLLHALSALGMTFFSMIGCSGFAPIAQASGGPGGNVIDPVVRAVDIARPAVVRIVTTVNGRLTVHFSPKQSVTFPQGSGSKNLGSYALTAFGTGTFISAHGDILTADHVVNPPHDQDLSQYLDEQAAADIADYMNKHTAATTSVTADDVIQELSSGQLASDPSYGNPQSQVFLSTDYSGPLTATSMDAVPAQLQAPVDRIEAESGANEKDVAIVHVHMDDVASVQLGDSSSVHEQDMLTIIGFPGNGDVSDLPTNLLTSSVNEIIVSSIKTTDRGAQVIQVGGNVEHGDSGGPALDSNGNVVGIVSFGLSDQGSTSFLQASNSARELVQKLHLDTAPGPFDRAWSQALQDYAATTFGHWQRAERELAVMYDQYPLFQALMPYLQYAQTQARQEQQSSSRSQGKTISPLVWTILAAAVAVVIGLDLFALALRRRKNKESLILAIPGPVFTLETMQDSRDTDELVAFGAPTTRPGHVSVETQPSGALEGMSVATSEVSGELRVGPYGYMNGPNARFYSMWGGEPAPPAETMRDVEQ